ncbi:MAG: hypothetical protein EXR58_00180 [Chloroflexi bacterium]|nr:hypothetical protein [Chloroflexota bacterium]
MSGITRGPRFFPNLPDNHHSLQAAVLSVLSYFGKELSWGEVEALTWYREGLASWSVMGARALASQVNGTRLLSSVDYVEFVRRGDEFFDAEWTPEFVTGLRTEASLGLAHERDAAVDFLARGSFELLTSLSARVVSDSLLENLLIASVDPGLLREGPPSETERFVVVFAALRGSFLVHDPGPPARIGVTIGKDTFIKAFRGDLIVVPRIDPRDLPKE